VVIRSNANPPIDENNPENILSLLYYLGREQYQTPPLLSGQSFTAQLVDQTRGATIYAKGKEKYEPKSFKINNVWDPAHTTLLPRMWSNTDRHVQTYRMWSGLKPNQKPSLGQHISYLLRYQMGFMYWRYFLWNYVGRESDIQNAGVLGPFEAFNQAPTLIKNNKGRNAYYGLPLLLGLIGLFFHARKDRKGFSVVLMLFFLTGMALILYLNSPPNEPRERDYIYVGSTYAFAIWIGMGVMALAHAARQKLRPALVLTALCLLVPVQMASQGWDDHDRSNRYFSVDAARNYLASCAPNAVLFTGGDNDTFPLWYVQEVEGFRTDVRVIVQTFYNADWYIDQLVERRNDSAAVPFALTHQQYYNGGPNDYLQYMETAQDPGMVSLTQFMELVRKDSKVLRRNTRLGSPINLLPARSFYLDVNLEQVLAQGIIPAKLAPYATRRMVFSLKPGKNGLDKKDLMTLDLIENHDWQRPLYFNMNSLAGLNIDLERYLVTQGLTARLLPVENPEADYSTLVDTDTMYQNLMQQFAYRQLNNPAVNYNEDYRGFVWNHRYAFNTLAQALLEEGQEQKAKEVLLKSLALMPAKAVPYDYTSGQTGMLLSMLGEVETGRQIMQDTAQNLLDNLDYMLSSPQHYRTMASQELPRTRYYIQALMQSMQRTGMQQQARDLKQQYEAIINKAQGRLQGQLQVSG